MISIVVATKSALSARQLQVSGPSKNIVRPTSLDRCHVEHNLYARFYMFISDSIWLSQKCNDAGGSQSLAAKGSQRNAPMLRPARPISSPVPWLAAQELHEDDEPWRRDETSCQNRGASSPMARLAAWHPLRWHNSNTSSLLDGLLVGRSASVRISATFAPPPLRTN